ncbi:hypothetical protein FQN49_004717 [Arthroderma sp. PD_2]|nr:hypothetical protein FQN49_004717 [Arthroderma sp. PD_2]
MSFYTPPSATSLASITDTSIPTSAVPTFPLPSVTFSPDGGSASAGNSRSGCAGCVDDMAMMLEHLMLGLMIPQIHMV